MGRTVKSYPLYALERRFPAAHLAYDEWRRRRERVVDTRVVRAEEYVVDAQREAGQEEDARWHHALRAPLQAFGRESDEGE